MSEVSHRTVKWRQVAALVAVVMLAAGVGQTTAGHAVLQRAGLIEKPPSYTSLAFQHPQSLPEQLSSAQADVPLSFVIRNNGADALNYQWSVLVLQGTANRRVATGTLRLASGHAASVSQPIHIICAQGQVQIRVSLARPAESIDAQAACWSPHR